jgi:hypothetical protein
MTKKKLILLGHLTVVALLLALCWLRLQSPTLRRPFEVDELLTVRYYTWVGVQPSGELRELNHIDDYYALGPPGARQLCMGVYCSMGRWPEPNNHVVNSLLINVSTALGGRDERSARVPALLGGVVFAGALYFLCASILQWRAAAPLVALWAWFIPYVVVFTQTARGYSWMWALQVLSIALAYLMARKARSVALGSLCALAAILSLMNVVSMAVDWLIPFFAALFLVRPDEPGRGEPFPEGGGVWRRYVLVQTLSVAGMGSIFFISHLASLYSSAQQNGSEFHSVAQFLELAYQIFDELFPNFAIKALAVGGAVGLIAAGMSRQQKFLAILALLLFVVGPLHYLLARKFPPARAASHFLPVVLLGAGYLAERIIEIYESPLSKIFMFGALALLSLGMAASSWGLTLESVPLSECLALARRVEPSPGSRAFVPVRTGTDYIASLYGPREWRRVEVVQPGGQLDVLLFYPDPDRDGAMLGLPNLGGFRLTRISGETQLLAGEGAVPENAWVFWYPDFTLLGLNAKDQDAYVRDAGCSALNQFARYQIKFDVYSYLQCYIFSPTAGSDSGRITAVVREGIRRFGGRAVVFVPVTTKLYY